MKNSILLLLGLGIAVNIFFATPFITYAIPDDGNRGCPEGKVFSSQLNNGRGGCVLAFQPLVGIPFVDTTNPNTSLPQYINALYLASISIAAFLAVIKIIFAGVKYMLSDVVPTKEAAKKDMYGALLGLLIVVGAVLILNTINPQLTGLDALSKIKGVNVGLINDTNDKPVYKYLEICNLYNNTSGLSCQKWCGSKKDGKYDIESKICSHNQPPQTTDDINDTSLVGEDILKIVEKKSSTNLDLIQQDQIMHTE